MVDTADIDVPAQILKNTQMGNFTLDIIGLNPLFRSK